MSAAAPPRRQRPQMDARIRARRRAVAEEQRRRNLRRLLSLAVVVALAAGAYAVTRSPLFEVDEVVIEGLTGERVDLVRRLAGIRPGERLLEVDLDAVRDDVERLPWVRSVDVARRPPSTISVAVDVRVPVAVVRLPETSWLLDGDGVVVGGGVDEDLVVIDAPSSVLPGPGVETSDSAVRNALEVHQSLPGPLRAQVDRYEAPSDRSLRLHLADSDVWVRFGRAERVDDKAQVIGLLLEQAREQAQVQGRSGLGVAELDVRAPDNPVLIPAAD